MTDSDGPDRTPEPAPETPRSPSEMHVRAARGGWWTHISPVWIVPLLALVISLGVAWHNYAGRGEVIRITFQNASGITAGQTVLKYRDVTVGKVIRVGFTSDLKSVVVSVRVSDDVRPYINPDAQFWVVRPEVTVRGITGLDTVLSGAYIAGNWDSVPGPSHTEFTGLEEAPLAGTPGDTGTRITLRMKDTNEITAGAPILYHGITVGSVGKPRLTKDGTEVLMDALIKAPYDKQLTSASRFWDISGFSFHFGAKGFEFDVKSLASLVEGGISFDTVVSGGEPAKTGEVFDVFEDEDTARQNVFSSVNTRGLPLSVLFDGSVAGLAAGADVQYKGLKVGTVTDIGARVEGTGDNRAVKMLANLNIEVGKLGLGKAATDDDAMKLLQGFVKTKGLRARLATSSILSGSLMVELVDEPDAPPAEIDMSAKPYPRLPSTKPDVTDFASTSQGLLNRVGNLPIEKLMNSAIDTLNSIRNLAADPKTRDLPGVAVGLLSDARNLVSSPDIKKILADLSDTAASTKAMVQKVQQGQTIDNLVAAINRTNDVLSQIDDAAKQFPQITDQVKALTQKLNTVPVKDLADSAKGLVDSANALISTAGAQQLPSSLAEALDEVKTFLAQLRQGGAIDNTNKALSAVQQAADSIRDASKQLPAMSQKLSKLVDSANGAVAAYGDRSRFNDELLATLRQIQAAAGNIAELARTIQRNPNSLLLGR